MVKYLFLLILLFSQFMGIAQLRFSQEECLEDFEVFRKSLEEAHPGLYAYFTQEEIARVFEKTKTALKDGVNGHVLQQKLLECVSTLRDAHTSINYPSDWNSYMGMDYLLPFHFDIRKGRIFITADNSGEHLVQPGTEVMAINGIHAITIQQRLNRHTPNDGNVQNYKNYYNGKFLSKRLMRIYPANKTYELILKSTSGELYKRQVTGVKEAQLYPRVNNHQLSITHYEETQTAVLTINSFSYNHIKNNGQDFFQFLEESFKEIRKKKVANLIIDVRNNGGGDNDLAIALYAYLSAGAFSYLHIIDEKENQLTYAAHANVRRSWNTSQWSAQGHDGIELSQQNIHDGFRIFITPEGRYEDIRKNKFHGKVQLLTGPSTFSAASIFAAVCQGNNRADLIGRGTGEACDSFCGGGSTIVTLPNSKLILTIPNKKASVVNARCVGFGREVAADVLVVPSVEDGILNRDVVLDKALKRTQL